MRNNRKILRWVKLELERLESREMLSVTPSTTLSFEGSQAGNLPLNWTQWSSDPNTQFAVTTSPSPALSGTKGFSVTSGNGAVSGAVTRSWLNETMPADMQVGAAVYVDSLIPAQVIARGSNLNTPDGASGPSFYAVELSSGSPGPKLTLVKDVKGTETSLGSINAPNYLNNYWLEETLDVEGSTVRAQLFDPKTGEYLNSAGQWQTAQAWALTIIDNSISGPGVVGLGRPSSYLGTVTFDDFSVQTPAADQSFDATPAGSLPDNWSSYSTNSNDVVAVADPMNPTPPSAPNALAITPANSGDTARTWLNTSLPADLSASAYTYVDTLTPAQVFARGSDLNSSTPNYYAVEVSRGYLTAKLVKVVNGVETDLGSVSSTSYVENIWVQETLGLSGNTLEAQIYRTDIDQYLNSSGGWQSTPTWALTATDSSITGGGQAGVGRPIAGGYVETNYFDDFTTATGIDAQGFDSSTTLPSGWTQYSTDGKNNYFGVAAAPDNNHFLSANNVLDSTSVGSTVTAQIWDANESLTNAQVSAGLYLTTPMPTLQLIARGTGLGTSTPSYYGLSVTTNNTGPVVTVVRVNGLTTTTVAQLTPSPDEVITGYISGKWVQVTLYVDGTNVRAQVYRADTGQYLNGEDLWQATPTYALNVNDTSSQALTGAGDGGLLRSNSSGTVYLDNFAMVPLTAESTPPGATISAPSGTLSGVVTISATATDNTDGVSKVEFYVDGNLSWVETAAPYEWAFDTSFVSNGTHSLQVMAYDAAGNVGLASTSVTTSNNTTITLPSFPRHQSNIGIAELAYKGDDGAPYDDTMLQNNVDVVIPDTSFLSGIESVAPNTPQLIYTNVSNIYTYLLTNWLNYAEENGIDPEQAFYHVSVATPFSYSDGDESVQPVDWFWGVYAYQDGSWQPDLTAAAHSGTSNAVPFGNLSTGSVVGDTMNVGYTDKFREIDINLSQARSGGSYVLEYPSAVDSNGNPTTWSTLTTLSDTTNGLTTSGSIIFDPPSNWVPAVVDSSASGTTRLYYVRFRTTAAFSTIPAASTVLGANFTQAVDNTTTHITSGTIPSFDYAADTDHDGYLNAQEYANRAPGMNAYFAYQGRLFTAYGQMRFATNPSSSGFRDWALQYYPSFLNTQKYATGYFVDNSGDIPPGEDSTFNLASNLSNFDVVEPTETYTEDYASLLNEIGRSLAANQWILPNTGVSQAVIGTTNGQTYSDPVIQKVKANYEEGGLSAVSDDTSQFLSTYTRVYYQDTNDTPSYLVMDSRSTDGPETDDQTQLTTLAAYYLLAPTDPRQGALDFFGGEAPWTYWKAPNSNPTKYQHWSPAAAYNIGTPTSSLPQPSEIPVIATGTESDGSTYYVYQRAFTGQNNQPVLVLYKPISMLNGSPSQLTGSASATTVTLPGSYYVLQADGTLSSTAQTTISLENGEGAILVDPPGKLARTIAGATMVAAPVPERPAAGTSFIQATSASSLRSGNDVPTTGKLLDGDFFERLLSGLFLPNAAGARQYPMARPTDSLAPSAELNHFFSQWVAAKMLNAHDHSSPSDESLWPADAMVDETSPGHVR